MHLKHLLNVQPEDAKIANAILLDRPTISEATARILQFGYERAKSDPQPRVLILGRWMHPKTGNQLAVGLNLNYLNDKELETLKSNIPQIYRRSSLKDKWWAGFKLMPRLWLKAYRQYDERFIHSIDAAEINPSDRDFYTNTKLGKDEIPSDAQAEIGKLNKAKAKTVDEPPKDPNDDADRLSADTIEKIAGIVDKKAAQNRDAEFNKQQALNQDKIEQEKEEQEKRGKEEQERLDIENEEEKKKIAQRELNKLKDAEEYGTKESFNKNINTIIESIYRKRPLIWKNPDNYKHWHDPIKFTSYINEFKGRMIDYAYGNKTIIIYNIKENKTIIDLVNDHYEMLALSGWKDNDVIKMIIDDQLMIDDNNEFLNNKYWPLIESMLTRFSNEHI